MKAPPRGLLRSVIRRLRIGIPMALSVLRRRLGQHQLVVGVTGSAGKSTVTILAARILAPDGRTHVGVGPNTVNGIHRTYLSAPAFSRYWVQEISGHEPGTVAASAGFVQPDVGVLTMIGDDHVKMFDSPAALAAGKGDLLAALNPEGIAVVNADDPAVMAQAHRAPGRVISYGTTATADLRILSVAAGLPGPMRLKLAYHQDEATVEANFPAARWAPQFAAAAAVGLAAGLPLELVARRLSGAIPDLYKDSVHGLADGTLIVLDCFKAPFWTVASSCEALAAASAPRKTFVLGTLSDYRGTPRTRYSEAARAALAVADRVMAYGPNAQRLRRMLAVHEDRLTLFERYEDLAAALDADPVPGELIYVKASGADHLERLMHRKREPVLCKADACGITLRSCNRCRHLYGRRISRAEAMRLR